MVLELRFFTGVVFLCQDLSFLNVDGDDTFFFFCHFILVRRYDVRPVDQRFFTRLLVPSFVGTLFVMFSDSSSYSFSKPVVHMEIQAEPCSEPVPSGFGRVKNYM